MNSHPQHDDLFHLAQAVKLLVLDVDGVLTDGKLYFSNSGEELKAFTTLDGQGIRLLQRSGVRVALITGRQSEVVRRRAEDLDIDLLIQNCDNKLQALEDMLSELGLQLGQIAYLGDDLPDLACIRRVGLGLAVPNGHAMVRQHARSVTRCPGGEGAVREVCDWILQAQGNYEDAIAQYL